MNRFLSDLMRFLTFCCFCLWIMFSARFLWFQSLLTDLWFSLHLALNLFSLLPPAGPLCVDQRCCHSKAAFVWILKLFKHTIKKITVEASDSHFSPAKSLEIDFLMIKLMIISVQQENKTTQGLSGWFWELPQRLQLSALGCKSACRGDLGLNLVRMLLNCGAVFTLQGCWWRSAVRGITIRLSAAKTWSKTFWLLFIDLF